MSCYAVFTNNMVYPLPSSEHAEEVCQKTYWPTVTLAMTVHCLLVWGHLENITGGWGQNTEDRQRKGNHPPRIGKMGALPTYVFLNITICVI